MTVRRLPTIRRSATWWIAAIGISLRAITVIDQLFRAVPAQLLNESGRVFYSGRDAFGGTAPLYVLGLNPGGAPEKQAPETVLSQANQVFHELPANWSAYRDESWLGRPAGTSGMQPRVLHALRRLHLNPGRVPASNLIFVRTAREIDLKGRQRELADECWAFHERVIISLDIKVVLCFGQTSGDWVQGKLGAHEHVETFTESNGRRWKSQSYRNGRGIGVVIATHPSIADWTSRAADPTHLVANLLA
jgi:hypothetical protein